MLDRAFPYKDTPISLSFAFQCTALDVITDYCFAEPVNALAANFFQSPFLIAMKTALPIISVFKYFPFLQFIINGLPDWLAVILNPSSRSYFELCRTLSNQIDALVENPALLERADHEIIYHHLLTPQPSKGQNSIPSRRSLMEGATNLVFAGSDNGELVVFARSLKTYRLSSWKYLHGWYFPHSEQQTGVYNVGSGTRRSLA